MTNQKIVFVTGLRTPFLKKGSHFKNTESAELGKIVIRSIVDKFNNLEGEIDSVILGTTNSGAQTVNVAQEAVLRANLGTNVNASTVSRGQGSAIEAIVKGIESIRSGSASVVIAGGADNVSQTRVKVADVEMTEEKPSFLKAVFTNVKTRRNVHKSLKDSDANIGNPINGSTNFAVAEKLALKYGIPRFELDKYAFESQKKAENAVNDGSLQTEIVPTYAFPDYAVQKDDDCLNSVSSIEDLMSKNPVVDEKYGLVTYANTQEACDGAAAVLMMTEEKAQELGLKAMCYVEDYFYDSVSDENEGLSALFATVKALNDMNLSFSDFDVFEFNESSAAHIWAYQTVLNSEEMFNEIFGFENSFGEFPREKLNSEGGSLAFGNPPGAGAARLIISAMRLLKKNGENRALVVTDIDDSQGVALILTNMEEANE